MNDQKSKRPPENTGMSSREIEESIKRIENDLYYSSDSVLVRLTRIEEKLEHVATREDLKHFATREDMEKFKLTIHGDMERLRTELTAHSNTLFRWTIGILVSGLGAILTVLKLT
ncbi:MAG: hypothetical protein OXG98_16500 [Gemmatimonadetes bacterium]|nr:hypothetical protein [Gemmatimonadota bacterium]